MPEGERIRKMLFSGVPIKIKFPLATLEKRQQSSTSF